MFAGKDATDDFEDVGHSNSARKMLDDLYIGDIDLATMPSSQVKFTPPAPKQSQPQPPQYIQGKTSSDFTFKILQFVIPLIILGVAVGVRFYTKSA